jgi:hypothetical protein
VKVRKTGGKSDAQSNCRNRQKQADLAPDHASAGFGKDNLLKLGLILNE